MRRDEVQGVVLVANWDRRGERPALHVFRKGWDARFPGEVPRATAAATYDAVLLLARSAERAKVRTGVALMDSLRHAGSYEGAFGSYRFIGTGDPVRDAVLLEIAFDSTLLRAAIEPPQ